jgi:hypothetical protein
MLCQKHGLVYPMVIFGVSLSLMLTTLRTAILIFVCSPVWAGPMSFHSDRYQFDARVEYFTSNENYKNSGDYESLPGDNSFNYIKFDLGGRYDWSKDFSSYVNLGINKAHSVDPDYERKKTALTDITLGADYHALAWYVNIIPVFEFSYPFDAYDEDSDEVMTNEGVMTVFLGSYFTPQITWLRTYALFGIKYRGGGRSMLMPWAIDLQKRFGRPYLGLRFHGFSSITDDDDNDDPTKRLTHIGQVNGGSEVFGAINPSSIKTLITAGYRFTNSTSMSIGYELPITGKHVARGNTIMLNLTMNIDPDGPSYQGGLTDLNDLDSTKQRSSSESDFILKTKDYDEDLFEEDIKRKNRWHEKKTSPYYKQNNEKVDVYLRPKNYKKSIKKKNRKFRKSIKKKKKTKVKRKARRSSRRGR